jgi:ubiquitin C-terminal hydrolase
VQPRAKRDRFLRSTYNITVDQYDEMLAAQGGGCKICGASSTTYSLHVDHDHETGKVRGILCATCNTALDWSIANHDAVVVYLDSSAEGA